MLLMPRGRRWIFGYGSSIFRPGFSVLEARTATLRGYVRRFWQLSPDHRGTPEAPGLVLTLVPASFAGDHDDGGDRSDCVGVAFLVDVDDALLADLDHREKAGYSRRALSITLASGEEGADIVYVGDVDNAYFAGARGVDDIVAHIAGASGPSGDNASYVLDLDEALAERGIVDDHVVAVAEGLRRVMSRG